MKCDLTPIGLDIIKAWNAAYHIAGRTGTGFNTVHLSDAAGNQAQYLLHKGKSRQPICQRNASGLQTSNARSGYHQTRLFEKHSDDQSCNIAKTTDSRLRVRCG